MIETWRILWVLGTLLNGRFKLLADFNNEAVLDKETGLVWGAAA